MTISFPVAFWTGALITDGLGAALHDPFWPRMSVVLVAMGTIGAILSSIFGYIDYRTVRLSKPARAVANGHLNFMLVTTAFFIAAFALRVHDNVSRIGIAMTILGSIGLLVGGYFGSELSNRYGVGVLERREEPVAG